MDAPDDRASLRAPTRLIRVFLLDDHEVVRRGVRDLLETAGDLEVVGEAGDRRRGACSARPGDVARRRGARRAAARRQRHRGVPRAALAAPEIRCLMLTSFNDDEALFDAIMAGASGYVLKEVRGAELVDSVRSVAAGRVAARSAGHGPGARTAAQPTARMQLTTRLTPQETTILGHLADGLTNRQIAAEMFLAEKTVKNYVSNLLGKLGHDAPDPGRRLRGPAGRTSGPPARHLTGPCRDER